MILQMQSAGPINAAEGQLVVNVPWNIPTPLGLVTTTSCVQNATTTIGVPTGATICIVQPPSTNAATYSIRGITGDIGVTAANIVPCVLSLQTTQFVIFLSAQANNQLFTFTWL